MPDKTNAGLSGAALYVGVAVIMAWLVTLTWLAFHIGDHEVQWSRLVFLLSSIEGVAFGAAGALFGTHIQKERVAEAKQRAAKAEVEAAENKNVAAKGMALAAAVKAEARTAKGVSRLSNDEADGDMSTSLMLANEILPGAQ